MPHWPHWSRIMNCRVAASLALLLLAAILLLSTGCNTVHGAGKDIEKGGEAIQKAAD